LLLILLLALPACDEFAEDKAEINAVFASLHRCNDAGDGDGIVQVLSEESFAAYEPVLRIALDGSREEVEALKATDRLEVLRIRARSKRSDIEKLSGREYCRFATSRGWYVTPPNEQTVDTLRGLVVRGPTATAMYVADGEVTGVTLRFVKENGAWRYDEPDAMKQWSRLTAEVARERGITVNELLLEYLEEELGKPPPASVWKPMKK
jgi:hypothetical protein